MRGLPDHRDTAPPRGVRGRQDRWLRSRPTAARGRAGGRVPRGDRAAGRDGRVRLGAGGGGRAGADDRGRGRARRQRRPGRRRGAAGAAGRGAGDGAAVGRAGRAARAGGVVALPGETGPRGTAGGSGASGRAGLSLDEGLLGSWTGPFGWLVTAEPVTPAELRALSEEIALRQRMAEGSADRFPERAVLARRLKERHAELQRGLSTGLWRTTIVAGGAGEASAARIAGLLCASADLDGLPYALSPAPFGPGSALEPGGDAVPASPFYGSTQLLAALAQPPESEVPGVRLALRPEFDVTQEPPAGRTGGRPGIGLGEILDRNLRAA